MIRRSISTAALAALLWAAPVSAQDAALAVASITTQPAELVLEAGSSIPVTVLTLDANGNPVDAPVRIRGLGVNYADGMLSADAGGDFRLLVSVVLPANSGRQPMAQQIPVTVTWPAVSRIAVEKQGDWTLYEGTSVGHGAKAFFANGTERPDASFSWMSSNPSVATVDRWGSVTGVSAGSATISASYEGVEGTMNVNVAALTASGLRLDGGADQVRQGDVVSFDVVDSGSGADLNDLAVTWSVSFTPDDTINAPGGGGIVNEGKFVGEVPGQYTVLATAGNLVAQRKVDVRPRGAVQDIELMGHGAVSDQRSSDLWMFEGLDGRDYGVTGTWGANGWAFFWDITNGAPTKIDSIQVDARTVNDVKVAPNGRYAALSREGASTRKDGPVLVDLADPQNPVIASYIEDDHITGGVHNMFAMDDYLFALAGGDKYVIFDVTDLENPKFVSEYNHPNSRIHDVWVHDGVAYSSEWGTGVVVVDVGNGKWGGSIDNPVFVTAFPYPVGRTHAAFPYYSESADKFYLFLGDEIMGRGDQAWRGTNLNRVPDGPNGTPVAFSGYIHIVDFTDPENPKDVARYEVPEFGTHNSWVEDDILYQAYYDGGVRMVDVSGELMGNLYTQGREIAVFKPFTVDSFTPNVSVVWGAQPYKGNIYFSDLASGLWSVKLKPTQRPIS